MNQLSASNLLPNDGPTNKYKKRRNDLNIVKMQSENNNLPELEGQKKQNNNQIFEINTLNKSEDQIE